MSVAVGGSGGPVVSSPSSSSSSAPSAATSASSTSTVLSSSSSSSPPSSSSAASSASVASSSAGNTTTSSAAAGVVEHQAFSSIDDSGIKMKIKRKNPSAAAAAASDSGNEQKHSSPSDSASSSGFTRLQQQETAVSVGKKSDTTSGNESTSPTPSKPASGSSVDDGNGKLGNKLSEFAASSRTTTGGGGSKSATASGGRTETGVNRRSHAKNAANGVSAAGETKAPEVSPASKSKSAKSSGSKKSAPSTSSSNLKTTSSSSKKSGTQPNSKNGGANKSDKKSGNGNNKQPQRCVSKAAPSAQADSPDGASQTPPSSSAAVEDDDDDENTKDSIPILNSVIVAPTTDGSGNASSLRRFPVGSTEVSGTNAPADSPPPITLSSSLNVVVKDASSSAAWSGGTTGGSAKPVVDPYEFSDNTTSGTNEADSGLLQSGTASKLPVGKSAEATFAFGRNCSVQLSQPSHHHQQNAMKQTSSSSSSSVTASQSKSSVQPNAAEGAPSAEGSGQLPVPISTIPNAVMRKRDVGVETASIGVTTDPDCLGPCEPGTSVVLEGIVWSESNNGILVVNVTWRGKTYVGTLMDSTKHDWAPPRFRDDSPSSEEQHFKSWRGGVGGHGARSASGTPDASGTEGRRVRKCRRDAAALTASNRTKPTTATSAGSTAAAVTSALPSTAASAAPGNGDSASVRRESKKARSSTSGSGVDSNGSMLECPVPNCNKKYRDANGLQYHQSFAHRKVNDGPAAVASDDAESHAVPPSPMLQGEGNDSSSGSDTRGSKRRSPTSDENAPVSKRHRAECDGVEGESADNVDKTAVKTSTALTNGVGTSSCVKVELNELVRHTQRENCSTELANSTGAEGGQAAVSKDCSASGKTPAKIISPQNNSFTADNHINHQQQQLLQPPELHGGKLRSGTAAGDAISPAYSDVSDVAPPAVADKDGANSAVKEHSNARTLPSSSRHVTSGGSNSSRHLPAAGQSPLKELGHRSASHESSTQSESKDGIVSKLHQQQQAAAAMEFFQAESMRQAYMQMFGGMVPPGANGGGGSGSRPGSPGPLAAGSAASARLPPGFGVDPAMAYRMQIMAAAAANAGSRDFQPHHFDHWMAAAVAATGGGRPPGTGLMIPPGSGIDGARQPGSADTKPVDMSAKKNSTSSVSGSLLSSRSPGPAGMPSSGRSHTPSSGNSSSGQGRLIGDSQNGINRSSSHSQSQHRDRHSVAGVRSHHGTTATSGRDVDGQSGNGGAALDASPLLHRRPDDVYDGGSSSSGRRSLDGLTPSRHRSSVGSDKASMSSSSSSGNRVPTPRSSLLPAAGHDDDSSSKSRWNSLPGKDTVSPFGGRGGAPIGVTVPMAAPRSSPASSPVPGAACGPYAAGGPTSMSQQQQHVPHHCDTPQTKRHVHTHHHTHVINAAYPVYGQYPASLLSGAAPALLPAVVFPDAYTPK